MYQNNKIGTLGEKSIHSFLKNYLEPDVSYHEVNVGPYVADIKNGETIVEIQTQQFNKLIPKLDYYISCGYKVKIVYPLVEIKYINWIDPLSGEIVSKSKSSHKGVIQDIFKELYWIVNYLENDLISLKIICLDADEYKLLDGCDNSKKRKATKIDKLPISVNSLYEIKSMDDLHIFIPDGLKSPFSSNDFLKQTRCKKRWVGSGLKILRENNIIKVVGKKGNAFLYEVVF